MSPVELLTETSSCGFEIGLSGQHANSASHFFDLGTAEALLIRPCISPNPSAHFSVLCLPRYRATSTHHSERQHLCADRLQVAVGRVKKMSRKSTRFHQRSANKPRVRSTFGFSDFVVVIPLRIWDFVLTERTQPCALSCDLFSSCLHVRHFQFVQPLPLLTRFFHHQSSVATQR